MCSNDAKGQTTTNQNQFQSWSPTPEVQARYSALLNQIQGVGQAPFQSYGGQRVADFTPDQQQAFQQTRDAQGAAQPYINTAAGYAAMGAQPSYTNVGNYMSPYVGNVVNATQASFNEGNAQQQQQVVGNAAAQGALGGDRIAVAQAELARQQNLSQSPVIAGLYNQGYQSALGAAQTDAARQANAAYAFGQLGQEAQGTRYADISALMGAGGQQQALQQQQLNVPYQNFLEQRAYPFQTAQWEAGLTGGIGSQMGGQGYGSSAGVTRPPPPNPFNAVAGLGLAAAGAYFGGPAGASAGWNVGSKLGSAAGGRIPHMAGGGFAIPYAPAGPGGVPDVPMLDARPMQRPQMQPMNMPSQPQSGGPQDMMKNAMGLAKAIKGGGGNGALNIAPDVSAGTAGGTAGVLPAIYANGGAVIDMQRDSRGIYVPRGYDDGGEVATFGDRFAPFGAKVRDAAAGFAGARNAREAEIIAAQQEQDAAARNASRRGILDRRGYDDGGPVSFDDRWAPVTGAVNDGTFDEPIREPSATAMDAWRRDTDTSHGSAAGAPVMISPGTGSMAPMPYAPQDRGGISAPVAPEVDDDEMSAQSRGTSPAPERSRLVPENLRMPLIAAGLGMMASKSPYFGQAVGEGGLQGIKTFEDQQQQQLRERHQTETERHQKEGEGIQSRRVDLEAKRLKEAADRAAATLTEQTRYHDLLNDTRKDANDARRDAQARTAYPGEGVDEEGKPAKGLYQFNPDTREYEFKPGKVIQKGAQAANRPGQTERLIEGLRKENPDLSYQEALALTKRAPNGDATTLRREALALSAAKADMGYLSDPEGTIEKYRQKYGLTGTGAPNAQRPAAKPGAALKPTPDDVRAKAREAIAKGAPREQVEQRLRAGGFDPSGL